MSWAAGSPDVPSTEWKRDPEPEVNVKTAPGRSKPPEFDILNTYAHQCLKSLKYLRSVLRSLRDSARGDGATLQIIGDDYAFIADAKCNVYNDVERLEESVVSTEAKNLAGMKCWTIEDQRLRNLLSRTDICRNAYAILEDIISTLDEGPGFTVNDFADTDGKLMRIINRIGELLGVESVERARTETAMPNVNDLLRRLGAVNTSEPTGAGDRATPPQDGPAGPPMKRYVRQVKDEYEAALEVAIQRSGITNSKIGDKEVYAIYAEECEKGGGTPRTKATWLRYLGDYRRYTGHYKKTPRHGREINMRSIIRASDLPSLSEK